MLLTGIGALILYSIKGNKPALNPAFAGEKLF